MSKGWVMITGATSGIGEEFARLFAADGHPLVLIARREPKLIRLASELPVEVRFLPQDLSQPGAAEQVEHWLHVQAIEVETLVNNAGFGKLGEFTQLDRRDHIDMVRLNVVALMELTHRLLPPMIERGRGGVLNVASLAGFQAGPYMATYYATKAFVLHFTEAVREETLGKGVTVSALCPGPVLTEFGDIAGSAISPLFRFGAMSCERATRLGYEGFRKGKAVILPGFLPKFVTFLDRITPRAITRKIVKRLQLPG